MMPWMKGEANPFTWGKAGLEPAQHDSTISKIPSFSQAPDTLVESETLSLSKAAS